MSTAEQALRLLAGPDATAALTTLLAETGSDEVHAALVVSRRLDELVRRERELTALYETAGDLSSRRDVQEVLQAIVTRARALLGTEAAYLMLLDEDRGDAYVRVSDGIATQAFRTARLAIGAGLGGLVVAKRQPYVTPDYLRDKRFKHTVDAVVRAEGLVAVLGVPLLAGEKVMGVLFAANRRERPFAETEVALLISLATHAAIAIETASLFADVRAHAERSIAEAEQRVRGDLLDDLLADTQPDADGLRRRARLLGLDLDVPHAVVLADPVHAEVRRETMTALTQWASEQKGFCGEHGRTVVVLVPGGDLQEAVRAAQARVKATIGGGGPGVGPAGMRDAHREARLCADVLVALGRAGEAACPADLGAFALLFGPAGRDRVTSFVDRMLGPLIAYDTQRGTELVKTVEAFFAADGSLARTAAALFIHTNTLYQRLERVTALLGAGWRTGDGALQLNLAIKLHRITAIAWT